MRGVVCATFKVRPEPQKPGDPMSSKRSDFRFFHRVRVLWARVDMQEFK